MARDKWTNVYMNNNNNIFEILHLTIILLFYTYIFIYTYI